MTAEVKALERLGRRALSGEGAHVETKDIFAGLDWKIAGAKPDGATHTVYQLLKHMSYWQEWVVAWSEGKSPKAPRHASGSWPREAGPATRSDWSKALQQFRAGLRQLERACRGADLSSARGTKSRLEMILAIGAHNSYHAGQVVSLRQVLGKWPPPSGGLTW